MKRQWRSATLALALVASAILFGACATTGGRISRNPQMFQSLSPTDQALVSQGQIRRGMTTDAVWLAWGTPDQKIPDDARGGPTETWMYLDYETPPSYGGPYYYGPFDWSYIPPRFVHPTKGVTFANGRVVYFQYMGRR